MNRNKYYLCKLHHDINNTNNILFVHKGPANHCYSDDWDISNAIIYKNPKPEILTLLILKEIVIKEIDETDMSPRVQTLLREM